MPQGSVRTRANTGKVHTQFRREELEETAAAMLRLCRGWGEKGVQRCVQGLPAGGLDLQPFSRVRLLRTMRPIGFSHVSYKVSASFIVLPAHVIGIMKRNLRKNDESRFALRFVARITRPLWLSMRCSSHAMF